MINTLTIIIVLATPNIHDLIEAKRWDEAEAQLEAQSSQARPRFEGLIAQGRGQSAVAAEAFERALQATPNVPQLHLHAAHAYFKLTQFEDVLRHAQAAKALRDKAVAQPLLEARALEGLHRDAEAYAVLHRACNAYQDQFRPCLELAALAHDKKLVHDVRRIARRVLALKPNREANLVLFHLLYGDSEAVSMLEQIAAGYPEDVELKALLAHVYAGQDRWFSAARLFEEASRMSGKYAFEAADQYRMARRYRDALRMNGRLTESETQQAQRLSILFEQKHYARITSMTATFKKPDARYRVAYAHYAIGDYVGARDHARALLDTSYRDEAAALLKAIGRDDTR